MFDILIEKLMLAWKQISSNTAFAVIQDAA